jgi:hypothetical protein
VANLSWPPIIDAAREWVEAQPFPVTLRQCFYFLVSRQLIPNSESKYKRLSELTATARHDGTFPAFADESHSIEQWPSWSSVAQFAAPAAGAFHLDRTEGQEWQVVVGVEKRGMIAAVTRRFGERGWRTVALGGYTSVTIKMDLAEQLADDGRPSVLIYAGDFDASGEDIVRDYTGRVRFDRVIRAALTLQQVRSYDLPVNPGKDTDPRTPGFVAKYGTSMQVEVDALDPAELDRLLVEAAAPFWDVSLFDAVVEEERHLQDQIRRALSALD